MTRHFLFLLAAIVLLALLLQGSDQLPRWLQDYTHEAAPEDSTLDLNEN